MRKHAIPQMFLVVFCVLLEADQPHALDPRSASRMARESTNILGAIAAVNIFIEAGLDKGGVLVHCAGGRSRSAAFVVAFIMSTQGCDYDYAYAQVRYRILVRRMHLLHDRGVK